MHIDIWYIIIALGVILFSMTLHELMHGLTAFWLGDDTAKHQGRLTLNPIKHIDPFLTIILPVTLAIIGAPIFGGAKPVPFNPNKVKGGDWGSALVALAGPLLNLVLAFISFGLWVVLQQGGAANEVITKILLTSVQVNLGFFIFNMIPFPPLDGSRLLYALAPEFVRRVMETIERFGVLFVFVIVFVASSAIGSLIGKISQFFIGLFMRIFGIV